MSISEAARKLPRPYLTILGHLADAGGWGELDRHGSVTVGPTRHPISGDALAWLRLVAAGLVAGEEGRIILTELGRELAAERAAGLVREAV